MPQGTGGEPSFDRIVVVFLWGQGRLSFTHSKWWILSEGSLCSSHWTNRKEHIYPSPHFTCETWRPQSSRLASWDREPHQPTLELCRCQRSVVPPPIRRNWTHSHKAYEKVQKPRALRDSRQRCERGRLRKGLWLGRGALPGRPSQASERLWAVFISVGGRGRFLWGCDMILFMFYKCHSFRGFVLL